MQYAVDAVANPQVVFLRLEVDVGGAIPHRLRYQEVHGADDGRLGDDVGREAGRRRRFGLRRRNLTYLLLDLAADPVAEVDRLLDVVGGGHGRQDRLARAGLQVLDDLDIRRVGHHYDDGVAGGIQRHEGVAAGVLLRHVTQGLGVHTVALEVDEGNVELEAQHHGDVLLADEPFRHQKLAHPDVLRSRLLDDAVDLLGRQEAGIDEHLAEHLQARPGCGLGLSPVQPFRGGI